MLAFVITGHTQLTRQKTTITAYINTHINDAIKLLQQSVNINSGTLNTAGVKAVGELYAEKLRLLGFAVEWVPMPDSMHRAGHLVATHKGMKGKRIFLMGHLDTVFEPDMPAGPFMMTSDSTATGQGIYDMKGGDVLLITALQALNAAGLLQDMNIVVYLTGDEERTGAPHGAARKDLIERAKGCDIALSFEPAMDMHQVATARRGITTWKLSVIAKTGHSSIVFSNQLGYGAIFEAARVLNSFREQLSGEQYLTFNPGLIAGGATLQPSTEGASITVSGKTNIVAPTTTVSGDLRYLTSTQRNNAIAKMQAIVAHPLNGASSTITFEESAPPMEPTAGNLRLLSVLNKVTIDMGIGASTAGDPGSRGAGDIQDIAQYLDCLDGLGAPGDGAHRAGETVNLKQFPLLINRAAMLVYRLAKE